MRPLIILSAFDRAKVSISTSFDSFTLIKTHKN